MLDILKRKDGETFMMILNSKTDRQKKYEGNHFASTIITYANELYFEIKESLDKMKLEEVNYVLEDIAKIHNSENHFNKDLSPYHPLSRQVIQYANKQDHSVHTFQETLKETILSISERYQSDLPENLKDLTSRLAIVQ